MRNVISYMSMSVDGGVDSDREHPGTTTPEGQRLRQWKLDAIGKGRGQALVDQLADARHLELVEATPFPSGIVVQVYRPKNS